MQSLALSTTTFVGQNLGANNIKRAKAGTHRAVVISLAVTAVLVVPVMIFAGQLISWFNTDLNVIMYGTMFIRIVSPFYLLLVVNQIYAGSLRGAGDTRTPTVIMLISFVVFRQIYLFVTSKLIGTIIPVAFGYPAGWLLCSIVIFIYYRFGKWEKNRVIIK